MLSMRRRLLRAFPRDSDPDRFAIRVITFAYWIAFAVSLDLELIIPDGAGYYAYAQSLVTRWDLSIVSELQRFGAWDFFAITPLGYAGNVFAAGTALLWLPFVGVVQLVSLVGRALGAPFAADGVGLQYLYAISLATATYGYFALVLTYRCARTLASANASLVAVLAVAFITPFFYYAFLGASCSHVPSAFCVANLLYWRIVREPTVDTATPHAAILGASAGLCALVRWELGLLSVILAVELVASAAYRERRWVKLAIFCAASLIVFAPQCVIWWLQFGSMFVVPQGPGFLHLLHPKILTLLFSSHHGLFGWSPILLAATLGMFALRHLRAGTAPNWVLTAMLVSQVYVCASVADVDAGASFGARRLVSLSPVFCLGLAALLPRLNRWWASVLMIVCGSWTFALLLAFKWQTLAPAHFAPWSEVLRGAAAALAAISSHIASWRPDHFVLVAHALESNDARWRLMVVTASVMITAAAIAIVLLRESDYPNSSVASWSMISAALVLASIIFAAMRSQPAAVPAITSHRNAMLDFSTYANSRSDSNPFRPALKAMSRCPDLAGRFTWGRVPFEIAPPAGGTLARPSVITTCGAAASETKVLLPGHVARRLHLAIVARAQTSGEHVAEVEVIGEHGTLAGRAIVAGRDVNDLFSVSPRQTRVVTSLFTTVQGYSLPVAGTATQLILRKTPDAGGCVAIFAVTVETGGGTYETVDLVPYANANQGVDFFRAEERVNYFPDLSAGTLTLNGMSFWLPARAQGITGGNTITTGSNPSYRQRVPLNHVRSDALVVLVDGWQLPRQGRAVARLEIEYTDGASTSRDLRAGVDVSDYGEQAAGPIAWHGRAPQDLSVVRVALDARRVPRYLWISALHADHSETSVAVFAITQERER